MKSKNKTREKQSALIDQTLLEKIENLTAFVKQELKGMQDAIKRNEQAVNRAAVEVEKCQDELLKLNQKDLFESEGSGKAEIDETLFEDCEVLDSIYQRFGLEVALGIAEDFGGCYVYIPKGLLRRNTHECIRSEYRAGLTYKELAAKYGYSPNHIRNIIHGKRRNIWPKKDVIQK